MTAILDALDEQHHELDGILARLADGDWQCATRCDGWDVADVVLHVTQTDELALASAVGRFDAGLEILAGGVEPQSTVDDGAAAFVASERGVAPEALLQRWRAASAALRAELSTADPQRRVRWVAGELSIRTLAATRLSECWIHTGDVADAVGARSEPTDRLEHVARLAWRTLPYAFRRAGRVLAGPVELDLVAPSGARWHFVPETEPATVVTGSGTELCMVAARRVTPDATALRTEGPDGAAVLDLIRTYA